MPLRDQQSYRPSAVAGKFYEGDAVDLRRRMAETEVAAGASPSSETLRCAVLPHAGYQFSLETAMRTLLPFRDRKPLRIVLLGPPHYQWFHGVAAADFNAYRTPFGDLPADAAGVKRLLDGGTPFAVNNAAHAPEHCLEVEMPLIQYLWGAVPVLPLLAGELAPGDAETIAERLHALDTPGTLFLISSDFTHYGRNFRYTPWGDAAPPEKLEALDRALAEAAAALDVAAFVAKLRATGATVCGATPILLAMLTLKKSAVPVRGKVMALTDSGKLTGEYRHVVGYAGIAFTSDAPGDSAP